jgi:hypothetical protein
MPAVFWLLLFTGVVGLYLQVIVVVKLVKQAKAIVVAVQPIVSKLQTLATNQPDSPTERSLVIGVTKERPDL